MNAGRAEQIGAPLELYERPATQFVGGFIGSPAMNFVPGKVGDGGAVVLADGTILPAGASAAAGRAVTIGLRPEHFALDGAAAPLRLAVELIEQLGADTIVHGVLGPGGGTILARLPGTVRIKIGETIPLTIPAEHIHLFDAASGTRL
jgi:sn-glycerol 3-phosphate transport system ATP-binding protein